MAGQSWGNLSLNFQMERVPEKSHNVGARIFAVSRHPARLLLSKGAAFCKRIGGGSQPLGTRTIAEHSIDSADAGRMCLIECSIREVGTK